MKRADRAILNKMVGYCERIAEMMQRFGATQNDFINDYAYQSAVGMNIIQIGELVTRLSSNIILDFPFVPWKQIRAMRNLYAHDYENVDTDIIWKTITEDIPFLRTQIQSILDKAGSDDE